jgi:DNA-binding Lrp family transcriptional regulator
VDSFDRAILGVLGNEARISWKDLAQRIRLSETPTVRRVKALETSGIIEGYSARINEAAAGRPISVFVSVSMDRQNQAELKTFEAAIADSPLIVSCFMLAGDVDYLLRVAVADVAEFQRFLDDVLRPIPGMKRISSSFALKPIVQRSLAFD